MRSRYSLLAIGALICLASMSACVFQGDRAADKVDSVSGEITSGASLVIKAAHSGKCVEVANSSKANGASVQQATCRGGANQTWKARSGLDGKWEIIFSNSGKCLEVAGASTANGDSVDQSTCSGAAHQRWSLISSGGNGQFQIKSVASGKCLDVTGVSTADGATLQQWTCGTTNANQRFALISPGGSGGGGGGGGGTGGNSGGGTGCDAPGLVWKTGAKTNYISYPEPGSEECIKYSGCKFEGLFAACTGKRSKSWVMSHNIVAAFPNFASVKLHDLCLRSGSRSMVVTVLDTCGDADCDGCCTQNRGNADALIDIESFTDARWGLPDGRIEWADLGPTRTTGCQ